MNETDIKTKIAMLMMMYDGKGKLTKFQDDIYGFVDETNKVQLIDLIHNKIISEPYNIRYIGDDIILLSVIENKSFGISFGSGITTKSIILNRRTFEVIDEQDTEMAAYNKIIISQNYFLQSQCKIYNMQGKELCTLDEKICNDFMVQCTDRDDYYIFSFYSEVIDIHDYEATFESEINKQRKTVLLVKYDEHNEDKPIEIVWKSNKFDVENIGYGLYKISDVTDFRKAYVYDIMNLRKIELDV